MGFLDSVVGRVIAIGTAVGLVVGVVTWGLSLMTEQEVEQVAAGVVERHEHDIEELLMRQLEADARSQKSFEGIESALLVPRLQNLLNLRCESGTNRLTGQIETLRSRFYELNGREFPNGSCGPAGWEAPP